MIAGLDWSLTCPAICLYDRKKPLAFDNCKFFFLTGSTKFVGSFDNVHGFKMPLYQGEEERHHLISDWAIKILNKAKVTEACLEGYAMGAKGRVFAIAENIGLLKHKMWQSDIKFITPAPTQVKKMFTGKGNANKSQMYEALLDKNVDVDLTTLLQCKSDSSPLADITDAYAMVDFYINNLDSKV